MKTNKTSIALFFILLIFIGISIFFYMENKNNMSAASKTIKGYQTTNKEQENRINELSRQILKMTKEHSAQELNEKSKNEALLSEKTLQYDELMKYSLGQEQEIFLLEQQIKSLDEKYSKLVCHEPKPQAPVKPKEKAVSKPMVKKTPPKVVVKNDKIKKKPLEQKTSVQNIIINNYVIPSKNNPAISQEKKKSEKAKLPKYYPVDGLN